MSVISVSCGGPPSRGDYRDSSSQSDTPAATSSEVKVFLPDPKAEASGEDHGATCLIEGLPDGKTANEMLPDPFLKFDATVVKTKADWRCRREEIRKLAETFAFGPKPPPPVSVTGTVSDSQIDVEVVEQEATAAFTVDVYLPEQGEAPYPAIIVYGSAGSGGVVLDQEVLDSEGVATIIYNPYAVAAEGNGRSASQSGAFYDLYGGGSPTGLLMAWAWGVSRIIDVVVQSDGALIDPRAIGVTGCSRFGKGAFIAGAFDERVALTLPIESGTAGVPLWRGIALGELAGNGNAPQSLSSAYSEQPWFGRAFQPFVSKPENAPLDTHELVGMVAPRGLFIMDNPHIGELAPKSGHAAALAGAEIYRALGVAGNLTYWSDVQSGTHCGQRPEWSVPLRDNLQHFLKNMPGDPPGVIKAYSSQSSDLADWRDWDTPRLE